MTIRALVTILISAAIGAAVLASAASTNTGLALPMGALLGASIAVMAIAFPFDLDYRERRTRR